MEPITCRAAVLYEEGKPILIENVIVSVPGPEQVRVRIVAAGICASDAHFVWGQQKLADLGSSTPSILGHEGAGIIESVGSGVTTHKVGDHVLATFAPECGECHFCTNCDTNLCMKNPYTSGKSLGTGVVLANGGSVSPLGGLGVYSEYVVLHQLQVVKVPDSINLQHACIISCAVPTGFYSATNQAKVTPQSTAAVWGLGAIGLNAVFGCKYAGAKNIIGIDINNDKKEVGEEFGVTEFVNPLELDKPVEQYLMEKYGGVDFALECIGHQAVLDTALASLSAFGTLAMVGVAPKETQITYPAIQMLSGRRIVGGLMGNKPSGEAFAELTKMYANGEYDIDRLVTNKFSLDQINEAFQTLKDGKCIRSLIIF